MKSFFWLVSNIVFAFLFVLSCMDEKTNPIKSGYSNEDTIIPKTTKVVDSETALINLESISSDSSIFTFNSDILKTTDFNAGDVFVLDFGDGFLRKITGLTKTNNQIILQTELASLTDAFEKASFNIGRTLTIGDIDTVEYSVEGIQSVRKSGIKSNDVSMGWDLNFIIYDKDNNFSTTGDQVRITGKFDLTPAINAHVEIDGFKIKSLDFGYTIEEALNINLEIALAALDLKLEKKILHISFNNFIIVVGGIPIIIRPILDIYAGIDVNIGSNITTGITQNLSYDIDIQYENNQWSTHKDMDNSFSYKNPTLVASATAEANLKPRLKFKIYGITSPFLYAKLFSELEANISTNPWWTLYAGGKIGAGVIVQIFSKTLLDYEARLIEYRYKIAEASEPFNTAPTASFTVNPISGSTSTVFNFNASGSSDKEDSVSVLQVRWDWEDDGSWDAGYSTTKTANHLYASGGTITVKMQVKDTGGLTCSTMRQLTINSPPTASFTVIPTSGYFTRLFYFYPVCSDNEDPNTALVVRWDWENDGSWDTGYSTLKTMSHQYSSEGTKRVKMEVMDTGGLTHSTIRHITVDAMGEVTDVDGNIYKTIIIGDQEWMAENLKVTHYRNGDAIPNVTTDLWEWWNGDKSGAYWCYDNNDGNIETYGLLYNGLAVHDSRNIAPVGWHVPTDAEFNKLVHYLQIIEAGGKLKERGTAHWKFPNTGATNETGFTALPGGRCSVYSAGDSLSTRLEFEGLGTRAVFWTSSPGFLGWGGVTNWLHHDCANVYEQDVVLTDSGFSVRCIKN